MSRLCFRRCSRLDWAKELFRNCHCTKITFYLDQAGSSLPGSTLLHPLLHGVETHPSKCQHLLLLPSSSDCSKMEPIPWRGHVSSGCYLTCAKVQHLSAAEDSSTIAASNDDFLANLGTPWPQNPECLSEWRPPACFSPTLAGRVKLVNVGAIYDEEAGGGDGDCTGAICHILRKSWSLLPLHAPCC